MNDNPCVDTTKIPVLHTQQVDRLLEAVERDINSGLLPAAQIALAYQGNIVLSRSYGCANENSLICIFSASKAIVCSAAWLLIQDGLLDIQECVADIIPEFASNDKDKVTVEQLFTHTAGFPYAPFQPLQWHSKTQTLQRFAQWRLTSNPGTQFDYHPTASMWVVAEIIERRSQMDFRQFIRRRILEPMGLDSLYIGLPDDENQRCLNVTFFGNTTGTSAPDSPDLSALLQTEVSEEALLNFNRADIRAVGVPGGGGFSNASDLSLFYQGLLHGGLDKTIVWEPETLAFARQIRTGKLTDSLFKKTANRGLGIVVSGDENRTVRGFGKHNSPKAFGHNGAGGQIAWADPVSGVSFVFLTPGHDRNIFEQNKRMVVLNNLASRCIAQ